MLSNVDLLIYYNLVQICEKIRKYVQYYILKSPVLIASWAFSSIVPNYIAGYLFKLKGLNN